MALFASREDRERAQFTRAAMRQGVLSPGERWLATATADILSFTRVRAHTTKYMGMPSVVRLGFTSTRFIVLTDNEIVAVDLLMLSTAQWRHTEGKLPSAFITWLGDTVPGMGGITVGRSRESTITEAFVRQLEEASDRRKAEFPSEVRSAVDEWRSEIWRRNNASVIISQQLERIGPSSVRAELPIALRCVAQRRTDVDPEAEPFMWANGQLQLRADGKVVARVEPDYTVAMFEPVDLTRLIVPGPTASPGAGARWEIAYDGPNGERFLAFDAPTMALYPGMLDESCDDFLCEAGLDAKIGLTLGDSEPAKEHSAQDTSIAAAQRSNPSARRPPPKGRK